MLPGYGYFRKCLHRMGKTAYYVFRLYEEGEVIVLTSIIGTITSANIIGIMTANRENLASVANYVDGVLRLEKRDI